MNSGNPDATNYYDRLGVSESDSCDEIETVARKLVPNYHPDRDPDSNSEAFQRMKEARTILTDEQKRQQYDSEPISLQISTKSDHITVDSDVKIRVTDRVGNGIPKVDVTATSTDSSWVTDGDGNTTVEFSKSDEYTIQATKHDYDTKRHVPTEIEVSVEEPIKELSILIQTTEPKTGEKISIKITDEHGNPVPNAKIELQSNDEGSKQVETETDGIASFTIETPGTYYITSKKSGFESDEAILSVSPTQLSFNISQNTKRAGEPFSAVVTDHNGNPVADIPVVLRDSMEPVDSTSSDSNGMIQLTAPSEGTYTIQTDSDTFENIQMEIVVSPSETTNSENKHQEKENKQQRNFPNPSFVSAVSIPANISFPFKGSYTSVSRLIAIGILVILVSILPLSFITGNSGIDLFLALLLAVSFVVLYDPSQQPGSQTISPAEDRFAYISTLSLITATALLFIGQGTLFETLNAAFVIFILGVFPFIILVLILGGIGWYFRSIYGAAIGATLPFGYWFLYQFTPILGGNVKDSINEGWTDVSHLPWAVIDELTILSFDIGLLITMLLAVVTILILFVISPIALLYIFNLGHLQNTQKQSIMQVLWEVSVTIPFVLFIWRTIDTRNLTENSIIGQIFTDIIVTETGFVELVWLPFITILILHGIYRKTMSN